MAPKRGERVAPPAGSPTQWELRFATNEAAKGWDWLCQQAPSNTETAWQQLRTRPDNPAPTSRHHRLKGRLASAIHRSVEMEQWQYEVTSGGRICYAVDTERTHCGYATPVLGIHKKRSNGASRIGGVSVGEVAEYLKSE